MANELKNETLDWQELVAQKRDECQQKIPQEWIVPTEFLNATPHPLEYDIPRRCGLLSDLELDITENYSAAQLLTKLAVGDVSSLDVTTAFCKRAAIAQQLISCLTETCFPQALERARFLDEYLKRERKPIGPLHGLPISLKDSFCIKGLQATVGYVSFLSNEPETQESALVTMLLQLGAVLYVKTNIPQTMMTGDSENNIFGRTLNPHNTALTAGGSSGGEGALVGFRGSILGVGTDIAGSIRIPALCCGLYGFKPTTRRIPFGGQVSGASEGLPGLVPAAGPLGHSIEDIQLFMKTVVKDGQAWEYDHTAIGAPWIDDSHSTNARNGSLNIGILPEDKQFPLHPPVKRALDSAIQKLARAGHRIIKLDNQNENLSVAYASRLAFQFFIYAPSGDHIAASGEPLVKSVARWDSPMFTGPFPVDQELGPFEKIQKLHEARQLVSDSWRQVWVDQQLDVILAPGSQNTAVAHDTYGWPPYTVIWNLLDYPACVIPFEKSSKELDPEEMKTGDDVQPDYIPTDVDGAPCSVQVITPYFRDEACLRAANIIDKAIRGNTRN
ncbi:general amidase-B [Penicillium angulare]|uniref:general amidase-B n=1 Tax=Penicillium angulare TaxID=116970 RepID=UPI002540478E|nr:general amidase-B [Penicillium angulare]KAJ5280799.1 general amidase-B [Penicillium angulare]